MTDVFSSQALEANLVHTREVFIEIPEEQLWFIELSKSQWGIHKRTQEFFKELNHKYRNNQHVIESLHNICLSELWFYNSLDESERALTVLINIFKDLLESDLNDRQRDLLTKTLIKFMDRLANLKNFPKSIIFQCIDIIHKDKEKNELLYIQNSGYFKTYLNKIGCMPEFHDDLLELTAGLLSKCIDYWEETAKTEDWFKSKRQLFRLMNEETMKGIGHSFFDKLRTELDTATEWDKLSKLMFYNDISNYFRSFTEKFNSSLETIYYLYYLLHLPGMTHLNVHLLYDMNRNLRNVFKELDQEDIISFLDTIMQQFKELQKDHSGTVLDCIATLGKEIINTKNQNNIFHFVKWLTQLGFIYPGELILNSDWQIQVNTNHVKNIRVWLDLIEYAPSTMRELLASLIVNLKLGGIFISDTDLFQRDVTKLLNSNIEPVFREIKQLARLFPIYFRDIGAEGKLRDVTTTIDESSLRKDRLIHFLRKQIHTESNNTHIMLTKKIIMYWYDGNTDQLKDVVPEDVFIWLDTGNSLYVDVHEILITLCKKLDRTPEDLLQLDIDVIKDSIATLSPDDDKAKNRVSNIFEIYFMLLEKYSLESDDILSILKNYSFFSEKDINLLQNNLQNNHSVEALNQICEFMDHLKCIILKSEESEAFENIYYKRHIAAGIPSMYGQYMEPKFEALGLMYRLERTASKLIGQLLQSINLEYITAKTFRNIYNILVLFKKGLELDGIYNQGFNSHLDMLKFSLASPSFSFDQYINIFQFMAKDIKRIISEYFFDVYERPLKVIIPQVFSSQMPESEEEKEQFYYMESEKFLRDHLSLAFLVQDLDNFITNIIGALKNVTDNYSNAFIENMMTYDPDLTFSLLNINTMEMDNPVFIGAKAFFLKKLIAYGFPVPPGFILTTEVFRHRHTIKNHPYMNRELDLLIKNHVAAIEHLTGQKYGDPANPLFFSVRSGSSISLPGAMRTFLNVGINDEIAEVYSKREGFGWASWDCYRRFLQSWGMSYGVDRDIFDQVMLEHKEKRGVERKIQFTSEQMKEVVYSYKKVLKDYGIQIKEEPLMQLKQALISVLDSWHSEGATQYRNHMQIADEWGTAVLVQKMVLGNLSSKSGTGVIFTSSPFNGHSGINLYGDFAICSQGEDVVSGLINPLPITEKQRKEYHRDISLSLESGFPQIYKALNEYAENLIEKYGFVHQEIEFTFESDNPEDLYILQIRNQNMKKQKSSSGFMVPLNEMNLCGHGIGVGSGALSGLLAFDMEDIKKIREKSDLKIILARPDTVPDDIPLIFNCDGLITGKGGITSHAAVTAVNLGKVCIVNCKGLKINESEKTFTINGHHFKVGDKIAIDGDLGNIYEGSYATLESK